VAFSLVFFELAHGWILYHATVKLTVTSKLGEGAGQRRAACDERGPAWASLSSLPMPGILASWRNSVVSSGGWTIHEPA